MLEEYDFVQANQDLSATKISEINTKKYIVQWGGRWRKYTPVINSFNINSPTFDTKPIILGQKFGEKNS